MSQTLLNEIAALEGSERLIAFETGLRVGYAHLGDQWLTFRESARGGYDQCFHPDAYTAYRYVRSLGLADAPYRILES